jgi:propionaldehyde dehydrogenase
MPLTQQEILRITDEIVRSLTGAVNPSASSPAPRDGYTAVALRYRRGGRRERQARAAGACGDELEKRGELIAAMREAAILNAEPLAKLAHEETGYGRVADKIQKNLLVARRTPGVEDLVTRCETGDHGMMLIEQAPFGVIGSITPSTNPTATIINNSISMIAAGNAVVFNPHPRPSAPRRRRCA